MHTVLLDLERTCRECTSKFLRVCCKHQQCSKIIWSTNMIETHISYPLEMDDNKPMMWSTPNLVIKLALWVCTITVDLPPNYPRLAWPDPVPSVRNGVWLRETNIRAAQLSIEVYTDRIVDCGDLQARFRESLNSMLPEISSSVAVYDNCLTY